MPMSLIIEHALSSSSRHGTQHASTMSGGDPHIRLKNPLPAVLADLASWRKIQIIALQRLAYGNAQRARRSTERPRRQRTQREPARRILAFIQSCCVFHKIRTSTPPRHCKACYVILPGSNLLCSISTWHSLPVTSSGVLINAAGENGGQAC